MTREETEIKEVIDMLARIDKDKHTQAEIRDIHTNAIRTLANVLSRIHDLQKDINSSTSKSIERLSSNIVEIRDKLFGSINQEGKITEITKGIERIEEANNSKKEWIAKVAQSIVSGSILIAVSIFFHR